MAHPSLAISTPSPSSNALRLLMPTVRSPSLHQQQPTSPQTAPRSPRLKPTTTKLIRSRSGSASFSAEPAVAPPQCDVGSEWIGLPGKFQVVQEELQIQGYQMYAVEKWIVERTRPVIVLTVYTGDPSHKITVTALSPLSSLTASEAQAEWESALHHLRRDGARPKQTPSGTLHTTSLANFRSDFTIVHIPNGDFLAAKDQLYTNIGLLRMGCSGRSAVGLEDVSETTKDRFLSMYHLPDPSASSALSGKPKSHTKSKSHSHPHHTSLTLTHHNSHSLTNDPHTRPLPPLHASPDPNPNLIPHPKTPHTKHRVLFNATVLELVKLIQAALAISGLFPLYPHATFMYREHHHHHHHHHHHQQQQGEAGGVGSVEMDGLLCDVTVEGIQRWVSEVGESSVGVEPMERVADPSVVSALLSLVLASRNKLAAIGYSHVVPKDPFLHPQAFCAALATYTQSTTSPIQSSSTSLSLTSPFHTPHTPFSFPHIHSPLSSSPVLNIISPTGSNTPALNPLSTTTTTPTTAAATPTTPPTVFLTLSIVNSIATAFAKSRSSDSRKMHRVLLNKLDDLATDLRGGEVGVDEEEVGFRGGRKASLGLGLGLGGRKGGGEKGDDGGGGGGGSGGGGGGILGGIGDLASGLGLSGSATGAGGLLEPTSDLRALVRVLVTGEKGRDREREKDRDGVNEGGAGRGTAGSMKGLWSGRVGAVVRMREKHTSRTPKGDFDKDKEKEKVAGVWSDGETDKTTEDENDSFGGIPWSGRMQKKIESWTKMSRPHKRSMDLSKGNGKLVAPALSNESSSSASHPRRGTGLTPPHLHLPRLVSRDAPDEEDLLSSGQVSPISGAPPFMLGTADNSTANFQNNETQDQNVSAPQSIPGSISDYERRVNAFNKKRPWPTKAGRQSRAPSWSDRISARDEDDQYDVSGRSRSHSRTRTRTRSRLNKVSFGAGGEEEEEEEEEEIVGVTVSDGEQDEIEDREHRRWLFRHGGARRRHSFHDVSSFGHVRVLPTERMGIDVGLATQLLVMLRREEHLENVLACLQVITSSLSTTNASLHEDYHSHQQALSDIMARTQVIAQIEAERVKAEMITQERKTLRYESEQFRVDELWHMASPPRRQVLDLREKVFGTGGRRLPTGVRGAHGRFNRLQWTLDGGERLVDLMGRTESEVEEEAGLEARGISMRVEEEEEDVVKHPGIKPMWLLRFFTSWGARWSAKKEEPVKEPSEPLQEPPKDVLVDSDASVAPVNGHAVAEPLL